jgi:ABC-type tungstate transport system permease subunit
MKSTASIRILTALTLSVAVLGLTGCKSINLSMPTTTSKETSPVVPPLVEKRETLTATGYAVISVQNHKNSDSWPFAPLNWTLIEA